MPFDDKKYEALSKQGDAAGVALDASIALTAVDQALAKLEKATGADISKERAEIVKFAKDLFDRFTSLTGWVSKE